MMMAMMKMTVMMFYPPYITSKVAIFCQGGQAVGLDDVDDDDNSKEEDYGDDSHDDDDEKKKKAGK